LQEALLKHAEALGVEVMWNCRIDAIDVATPSVRLQTGQVLAADLIVGADGRHIYESD
jgi:2-polyprenyl-6-methoxyphenol hydroxylase-like FAD-dependent oxidoreductase